MTPPPPPADDTPGYRGRIRRGPMAADAFTQVRNAFFRDPRLSYRDKGIFAVISTHRDGFGVSAEAIAAGSPTDGVSAVKTSLRNLEKYGYLRRTRQRKPDGTLGGAVYFITDQPEAFGRDPELESRRSQPAVPQPTLAEPTQAQPTLAQPALAEPTVAESTHKKTNSKNTIGKNTLSPPAAPGLPVAAAPAQSERETEAAPQDDSHTVAAAWQDARNSPRVRHTEEQIAAAAAVLLADGHQLDHLQAVAAWMAGRGYTDLARAVTHREAPQPAGAPGESAGLALLPNWCGDCDEYDRTVSTYNDRGRESVRPCGVCNPRANPQAA